MFFPWLLPALVLRAALPGIPEAMEMAPGLYVLRSSPAGPIFAALKEAGITHVVNLRRDGEKGFDDARESAAVFGVEVSYVRIAMPTQPTRDDFDLFRMVLKDLPPGSKVLVHCGDGNRAAAAACAYAILEKGIPPATAWARAREAGLNDPRTEDALRTYLGRGSP